MSLVNEYSSIALGLVVDATFRRNSDQALSMEIRGRANERFANDSSQVLMLHLLVRLDRRIVVNMGRPPN